MPTALPHLEVRSKHGLTAVGDVTRASVSGGNVSRRFLGLRSLPTHRTDWPASASCAASRKPAGPFPTTSTSQHRCPHTRPPLVKMPGSNDEAELLHSSRTRPSHSLKTSARFKKNNSSSACVQLFKE